MAAGQPLGAVERAAPDAAPQAQPAKIRSLSEAISFALANNPDLRSKYANFEALALESPQVSSLPDPRLNYTQFVEGVQTRTGEQEFILGVSQTLPWFGKLQARGDAADALALAALDEYRTAMLDLSRDVTAAWYWLAYEQAAEALAIEDKQTLEQSLGIASSLYASGQRGREALLRAQTELARIENELLGYPARTAAHRHKLARLIDTDGTIHVEPLGEMATTAGGPAGPTFDRETLIQQATSNRPELAAMRHRRDAAEFKHRLTLKDDYPDLTVGAGYIDIGDNPHAAPPDEGDDVWNATLSLNIPLPNARRAAAKQQARKSVEEMELRIRGMENRIDEEIRATLPRLDALNGQLEIYRDNLVPLAEEGLSVSMAAYESGSASFLDLLDAQRTYIGVRRDMLKASRDHHLALTDLERAIGIDPLSAEQRPAAEDTTHE